MRCNKLHALNVKYGIVRGSVKIRRCTAMENVTLKKRTIVLSVPTNKQQLFLHRFFGNKLLEWIIKCAGVLGITGHKMPQIAECTPLYTLSLQHWILELISEIRLKINILYIPLLTLMESNLRDLCLTYAFFHVIITEEVKSELLLKWEFFRI